MANSPRWIVTASIVVLIMAAGALMTSVQLVNNVRVGSPFNLAIRDGSNPVLCPGEMLEYDVTVTVVDTPITLEIVRTWEGGPNMLTQRVDRDTHNYIDHTQATFPMVLAVPDTMPPGDAELRVVASAIYHESTGYVVPFQVSDSCD